MRTSLLPDRTSVRSYKGDQSTVHQHQSTDPEPLVPSLPIHSSQHTDITMVLPSGEIPNAASLSTSSTSSFATSISASHFPCSVLEDLISFASKRLVPGGRLVFWWPEGTYIYSYVHVLDTRSFLVIFVFSNLGNLFVRKGNMNRLLILDLSDFVCDESLFSIDGSFFF
jgi:hypothetical protein